MEQSSEQDESTQTSLGHEDRTNPTEEPTKEGLAQPLANPPVHSQTAVQGNADITSETVRQPTQMTHRQAPIPRHQSALPQPLPPAQPLPRSNAPAVLLNQSKPNAFVQQSALTTSNYTDIIHTQNPFQHDVGSSLNFQRISANVPNGDELRVTALNSVRNQKSISESLMINQKGAESSETLISKMYFSNETPTTAPILKCRSVSFSQRKATSDSKNNAFHIGVRALITSRRLIFVDSTKNNLYTLEKKQLNDNSIITPFRKGETYQTKSTITDDLWFKPLPLPTITGVEIYTSHRSEASQYVANRVAPFWFYSLLLGLLSFSISLIGIGVSLDSSASGAESNSFMMIGFPAILGIILLLASVYLYSAKAKVKLYNSINSVTKSRTINIGAYDNIQNCPTHISMEIEDSQPLLSIFQWCKELQNNCPHLNGEEDPLILM